MDKVNIANDLNFYKENDVNKDMYISPPPPPPKNIWKKNYQIFFFKYPKRIFSNFS